MTFFEESYVTDAKRAVRGLLYMSAVPVLRGVKAPRFMVLAGRSVEEIHTIRTVFDDAQVFSVDRDPDAVAAAKVAGATVVIEQELCPDGDRLNLDVHAKFDCLHLDFCSNVTPTPLDLIRCGRAHVSKMYAITIACGRESLKWIRTAGQLRRGPLPRGLPKNIEESIKLRLLVIEGLVNTNGKWSIKRVWLYRGRGMLMMTLAFVHNANVPMQVARVESSDVFSLAASAAKQYGTVKAARLFNIDPGAVADRRWS